MSLDVDVATLNVRAPLARSAIARLARGALRAERVRNALISVTLVDTATMARLNRTHLGHAGATDVISFHFKRVRRSDVVIGDVYICPDVARRNSAERRTGLREELARLVIHGVLHVLGYEHPESRGRESSRMWRRQEQLLARLIRAET
ncbi:MAG: rRNA maturation RNase YbeY [Gemmatimonadaceae bacterium]